MSEVISQHIFEQLQRDNFSVLSDKYYSERVLKCLAELLINDSASKYMLSFLEYMTSYQFDANLDWNVGSIVQHFDVPTIASGLKSISERKRAYLYESKGLVWAVGEKNTKDQTIIDFLYEVLNYAKSSESWWMSAFALEKLTGKSSINNLKRSLKGRKVCGLEDSLQHIEDKRNIVSILLKATNIDIKEKIFPSLKKNFLNSNEKKVLLNTMWLIGHLRLFDNEIIKQIKRIIDTSTDYEIIYTAYTVASKDPRGSFEECFVSGLKNKDPLIRKMSLRGLSKINARRNIDIIEELLDEETNLQVISEATDALSRIKNEQMRSERKILSRCRVNENGLIADDTDKWYADPSVYNIFSEAEDIENVCFDLVLRKIKKMNLQIVNPVDLATGTGKTFRHILKRIPYEGTLYGVDFSADMLAYLDRIINRQKLYVNDIKLEQNSIKDFVLEKTSSFIISSFGFPSRIFNEENCLDELKTVYRNLSDDGIFVTIGWDETFKDELNEMWYRYIPDSIVANSFNEWCDKRSAKIHSPRNCCLTWYKTNIKVPLMFANLEESVNVMGHLFGRDAANAIMKEHKTFWWMKMGVTLDTKETLKQAIEKMERVYERN